MSIAPTKSITAEDLLEMADGDQYELVDGQLVETSMSMESSWIAGEVHFHIRSYLAANPSGMVLPEGTTYRCFPDDPDMVRKPDVSYLREGRLPPGQFEHGHCRIAPDLAVEVISPNDLHVDLTRKLEDYFSAGIPLVWVVEPELRLITVYEQGGQSIRQVRFGEELTMGELLPGFRVAVAELFPKAPSAARKES